MKLKQLIQHPIVLGMIGALLGAAVILSSQAIASPMQQAAEAAPELNYQGRLVDPATGEDLADGSYNMTFALYTADTGGSPLWSESKSVAVAGGLFSTMLGDTTPLSTAILDGGDLWLGISVGGDAEMTPREPISHVPYAVHAVNAGALGGVDAAEYALAADAQHFAVYHARANSSVGSEGEIIYGSFGLVQNSDSNVFSMNESTGQLTLTANETGILIITADIAATQPVPLIIYQNGNQIEAESSTQNLGYHSTSITVFQAITTPGAHTFDFKTSVGRSLYHVQSNLNILWIGTGE